MTRPIYTLYFDKEGHGPTAIELKWQPFPELKLNSEHPPLGLRFELGGGFNLNNAPIGAGFFFSDRPSLEELHRQLGELLEQTATAKTPTPDDLAQHLFETFIEETSVGVARAAKAIGHPTPPLPTWAGLKASDRAVWNRLALSARRTHRAELGFQSDAATDHYVTPNADGTYSHERVSHHGPCIGRERAKCGCDPVVTSDRHFPAKGAAS
jgi:hypothetical protein